MLSGQLSEFYTHPLLFAPWGADDSTQLYLRSFLVFCPQFPLKLNLPPTPNFHCNLYTTQLRDGGGIKSFSSVTLLTWARSFRRDETRWFLLRLSWLSSFYLFIFIYIYFILPPSQIFFPSFLLASSVTLRKKNWGFKKRSEPLSSSSFLLSSPFSCFRHYKEKSYKKFFFPLRWFFLFLVFFLSFYQPQLLPLSSSIVFIDILIFISYLFSSLIHIILIWTLFLN